MDALDLIRLAKMERALEQKIAMFAEALHSRDKKIKTLEERLEKLENEKK